MSDDTQQMFPIFSIVSNNFEKDLEVVMSIFSGLEKRTHTSQGFKLSNRAEQAAGWWFYDVYFTEEFARKAFEAILPPHTRDMKQATRRTIESLQKQFQKHGSEAKVKMHGDMPFAARWWAWLMK